MADLLDVPGIRDVDDRRLLRFVRLMRAVDADPAYVGAVIGFESAWDPQKRNPRSNAVGLIQWTQVGAKSQNLTREQIAAMSFDEQLELVASWYGRFKSKADWRPADYYLAIFAPGGIGKAPGFPLYSAGTDEYEQNREMDRDGDGIISVGDVTGKFNGFVFNAASKPPVFVNDAGWTYVLAAIVAAGIGGGAYYYAKR